jgi:PhnB protein
MARKHRKSRTAKTRRSRRGTRKAKKKVPFMAAGYHTLTPYLSVHDGRAAVEFYTRAFGAKEKRGRITGPDGKIMHTELKIGVSHFMMADEMADFGNVSPRTLGKTTVLFMIYVKDADAVMQRAVAAGGKMIKPVELQFYGDRGGKLEDPFGYTWFISTHVEDVSPKEMARRASELYGTK